MEVVPVFLFTGMILTIACNMVDAVECYICSYNPSDYKNDDNNNDYSDVCSAGHFDSERVRTHDCHRGCEIVSMKDPNGELEMYYRNCVTNKQITYAYVKKSSKINDEEVYTCDFDLCNTATVGRHFCLLVLIITMLVPPVHWFFM